MPQETPGRFEQDLATLLFGVDAFFGADPLHESGTKHMIVDNWRNGWTPEVYADPLAVRWRNGENPSGADRKEIAGFAVRHGLLGLPGAVRQGAQQFDQDRKDYFVHLADALSAILQTELAAYGIVDGPSFEDRYRAATGLRDVRPVDHAGAKDSLRDALGGAGYAVRGRNTRDVLLAWKHERGSVASDNLVAEVKGLVGELLRETRNRLLSQLDISLPGHAESLSDIAFDGFVFRTLRGGDFTGSSAYQGGESGGRPLLRALFEYNLDHPLSRTGMHHLCSHEVMPGHYFQHAVQDILLRSGKLGFEATFGTMCTPAVALAEGWAQNALPLLFGSEEAALRELGSFGKDMRVELAYINLQDIAKHNVSLFRQRDGQGLDSVKRHVAEECCQDDAIVRKLSGSWATHRVFGPMYGPAYWLGRTVVAKAIEDKGRLHVAHVGLHLDGVVDIMTFQNKVYRN